MCFEIEDQPLDNFQNNLALITNHIKSFEPDYNNYQFDLQDLHCKYIFSITGKVNMNTEKEEQMNFIMSLRIFLNVNSVRYGHKLEDIISVDYLKIKIF